MSRHPLLPALGLCLIALSLTACDKAGTPPAEPANTASAPAAQEAKVFAFADFGSDTLKTTQGMLAEAGAYSENKGDAEVDYAKTFARDGLVTVTGWLSKDKGSGHGGIILTVPGADEKGKNLAGYKKLSLTLASQGDNKTLQVRLMGPNDQAKFRGCYPVATVSVTPEPAEYLIALDDATFPQLPWCKDMQLPIADTLVGVRAVEVIDNTLPAKAGNRVEVSMQAGKLHFER